MLIYSVCLVAAGGSSPGVLYEVQVPVISNVQCLNSYSQITDTMVCAGETDKDSCQVYMHTFTKTYYCNQIYARTKEIIFELNF